MSKLYELVSACAGRYALAVIKERNESGVPDVLELVGYYDEYDEAKAKEVSMRIDAVQDLIIIPPFDSGEVPPRETAEYFRRYYNQDVQESVSKCVWYMNV